MSKSKPQASTKKTPAAQSTRLLADPLSVLGDKIAKAVAKELKRLSDAAPAKRSKKLPAGAVGGLDPEQLKVRLAEVAEKVLVRALSSRSADGTALRMSLIAVLAQVEAEQFTPLTKRQHEATAKAEPKARGKVIETLL